MEYDGARGARANRRELETPTLSTLTERNVVPARGAVVRRAAGRLGGRLHEDKLRRPGNVAGRTPTFLTFHTFLRIGFSKS